VGPFLYTVFSPLQAVAFSRMEIKAVSRKVGGSGPWRKVIHQPATGKRVK
jgi:hypothetical protein